MKGIIFILVIAVIAFILYSRSGNNYDNHVNLKSDTESNLEKFVGRYYVTTRDLKNNPLYSTDKTKYVSHNDIPHGFTLRVFHTGDMITADYSEKRINFELNSSEVVVKAYIG